MGWKELTDWEHQKSPSQIAAILGRKRNRRQPNRSGDAFFPWKIAIASHFLTQEKSQGSLGA